MRVHLPDSDKKLVLLCQQSFQPVLTVLLHEGYFFGGGSLTRFLAGRSFKTESVKWYYFIMFICYCCP